MKLMKLMMLSLALSCHQNTEIGPKGDSMSYICEHGNYNGDSEACGYCLGEMRRRCEVTETPHQMLVRIADELRTVIDATEGYPPGRESNINWAFEAILSVVEVNTPNVK